MPSPDLLPKGRSFPSAAVPPLDDVLKGARRRRTRQAGLVGAVAAAAVAAATIAFVPHGSSDSLRSVTPTVPGHTTSPSPAGHAPSIGVVRTVPSRPKVHRVVAGPVGQSTAKTKHQPPGNGSLYPPSQSTASDQATTVKGTVGPPHRMTKFDATQGCTGGGPSPTLGWCSYYDGATSGKAGRTVTLATAVCRLPGQGVATLTSRTGRQAHFDVGRPTYPPSWNWAHGRTFAQTKTSIDVAPGTCVEWYVSWRIVDNAGQLLKPGKYYLDAWTTMRPASAPAYAGTERPPTFTVR